MVRRLFLVPLLMAVMPATPAQPTHQPPGYEVVIAAGEADRIQTPVRFDLPDGLSAATGYRLAEADGRMLPVQVDAHGSGWVIVRRCWDSRARHSRWLAT